MLNLKKAKLVACIKNKYGSFVTDPTGVAKALSDTGVASPKKGAEPPNNVKRTCSLSRSQHH